MLPEKLSPLALPFSDAISPSLFLAQITAAAENQLRRSVAERGNRALGIALASSKIILERGTVQVVFEAGIPVGAKLMRSGSSTLPSLIDGKTGRILKWGKVASKGRKVAAIAANACLVAVEAAHMLSGYDNAQRLKKVERSANHLISAHESELKARMEAIYRYSKELLHAGDEALTAEDRTELHRQSKELMELRARWRDDFQFLISNVDPAQPKWWTKIMPWKKEKSIQESRSVQAQESERALESVRLMHCSLMLQMTLAGHSGRLTAFQEVTLPDECAAWRSLAESGKTRARDIAGIEDAKEFSEFINQIASIADFWSSPKLPPTRRRNASKK